jgi:hypothetical protein
MQKMLCFDLASFDLCLSIGEIMLVLADWCQDDEHLRRQLVHRWDENMVDHVEW